MAEGVVVTAAATDKFSMAILSHPEALLSVAEYIPAELYTTPLNVYNCPAQIDAFVVDDVDDFMVTTLVAADEIQLLTVAVTLYNPAD